MSHQFYSRQQLAEQQEQDKQDYYSAIEAEAKSIIEGEKDRPSGEVFNIAHNRKDLFDCLRHKIGKTHWTNSSIFLPASEAFFSHEGRMYQLLNPKIR